MMWLLAESRQRKDAMMEETGKHDLKKNVEEGPLSRKAAEAP